MEQEEDTGLQDYIRTAKNDPAKRDAQVCQLIDDMMALHDQVFDNGMNSLGTTLTTVLLSYIERISYIDPKRKSYETYCRYADFLRAKAQKEDGYEANFAKEKADKHAGAFSMIDMLVRLAGLIPNPSFRVYLVLLTICLFKDEGAITKTQRSYLETLFSKIKIEMPEY